MVRGVVAAVSVCWLACSHRPLDRPDGAASGDAADDTGGGQSAQPPVIPIGYGALRAWDRWPVLRLGMRSYMRSTYDRRGGDPDASHFLREESDGTFTTLDVAGSGYLAFVRTNHWHGSPWHYTVDGTDHVVAESSTADPDHPVEGSIFLPAAAFPSPLALTWSTTKGADLSWVPIGFETSMRLGYERTHYGTGYYIFQLVAPGTAVSDPPATWTPARRRRRTRGRCSVGPAMTSPRPARGSSPRRAAPT